MKSKARFRRMMFVGWIALAGCASLPQPDELPPSRPIRGFEEVWGVWEGKAVFHREGGRTERVHLTFQGKGIYRISWERGGSQGSMRLADGTIRFGDWALQGGSITLHELDKQRYLKMERDDKSVTAVFAAEEE